MLAFIFEWGLEYLSFYQWFNHSTIAISSLQETKQLVVTDKMTIVRETKWETEFGRLNCTIASSTNRFCEFLVKGDQGQLEFQSESKFSSHKSLKQHSKSQNTN